MTPFEFGRDAIYKNKFLGGGANWGRHRSRGHHGAFYRT